MAKIYNYGDEIQAFRAVPHPTKRNEYVTKEASAKIIGFSHPNLVKRGWGWLGSALVEFADGHKCWNRIY